MKQLFIISLVTVNKKSPASFSAIVTLFELSIACSFHHSNPNCYTMDLQPDYSQLVSELERQELESGGTCSPQIYGQLLAIYLLRNDIPNAKLLWKRIPIILKDEAPELKAIWGVAKSLIDRNLCEVYGLLKAYEWPTYIKKIMGFLHDRTRNRVIQLLGQSYSHMAIEELRKVLGVNSQQEVIEIVNNVGWTVDATSGFVNPTRLVPDDENDKDSSQEQLQKLTEYVAFLENY